MFWARDGPHGCPVFYTDDRSRILVVKNSRVPLIPNFPRNQHDDGDDSFSRPGGDGRDVNPPARDGSLGPPRPNIKLVQTKPIIDHAPNTHGETTRE